MEWKDNKLTNIIFLDFCIIFGIQITRQENKLKKELDSEVYE